MIKRVVVFLMLVMVIVGMGCSDAKVVSANISKAADQFEIYRRVVFYNGITNEYILVVEGYCSIQVDTAQNQLELTVKTNKGDFIKHYLGLSDNVTYFAEQIEPSKVSKSRYRVIFKPSVIVPDVDFE